MLAIVIPYYSFFKTTLQILVFANRQTIQVYIGNDASNEDPTQLLKSFKINLILNINIETNLGHIVKHNNGNVVAGQEEGG
jgi:hypothetical protein